MKKASERARTQFETAKLNGRYGENVVVIIIINVTNHLSPLKWLDANSCAAWESANGRARPFCPFCSLCGLFMPLISRSVRLYNCISYGSNVSLEIELKTKCVINSNIAFRSGAFDKKKLLLFKMKSNERKKKLYSVFGSMRTFYYISIRSLSIGHY